MNPHIRKTTIGIQFIASVLLTLAFVLGIPASGIAQLGGLPGAFGRIGFGARGIGMGNAMTAVTTGDLVSYYNPALIPGAAYRHASASFGILSLDRHLNFLNFSTALPPNAGLSVGIVNAGVSQIDGRDGDGQQTGALRTSENQIFLGFGVRFPNGLSVGVNLKLFYYHLYTDVSSTTVGVDFGFLYRFPGDFTLALTVRDINSRYKWDTRPVLGQSGLTSEDAFPRLLSLGAAYLLPDSIATISAEVEISDKNTLMARAGVEVPLIPEFALRGGIDRVDLKEKGNGVRPSFGFSARTTIAGCIPTLHYAFVMEPFSPTPMHMLSLSVAF